MAGQGAIAIDDIQGFAPHPRQAMVEDRNGLQQRIRIRDAPKRFQDQFSGNAAGPEYRLAPDLSCGAGLVQFGFQIFDAAGFDQVVESALANGLDTRFQRGVPGENDYGRGRFLLLNPGQGGHASSPGMRRSSSTASKRRVSIRARA